MILSDIDIRKRLEEGDLVFTNPDSDFAVGQIQPASLDFRLGGNFKIYDNTIEYIDTMGNDNIKDNFKEKNISNGEGIMIHPGHFILGVTKEYVSIPNDLAAKCEGKSSLGRLGLIIHSTAGFIAPGFQGHITLEITNMNSIPLKIYSGMKIGQFYFEKLSSSVENSYKGKYSGQGVSDQIPSLNNLS